MAKDHFHLAWFLSQCYGPKAWRSMWHGTEYDKHRWMMPDIFVDLAKGLERGCFDYMIIEDSSMVPYTYKGSHDTYLQYGASTPKLDPAVLVPWLAMATRHLGLVPTLSTSEYPPYLLARLVNSLDHVTEGRIGWNCVTGSNDGAAENYGHAGQRPHDERYEVADEFADVVTRLWEAWDEDAVVLDPTIPMFADGKKVRPIHHEGKYQGARTDQCAALTREGCRSVRPAARRAARPSPQMADTIITNAVTVDGMKSFREDIRRQAAGWGRNPDDVKVLFLAYPIVDTTMDAARERRRIEQEDFGKHLDLQLSGMSRLTNIDFSQFDPDQPLPEHLTTNGHQSSLAKWIGKTPRSLASGLNSRQGIDLVGTPDHVAGLMQEIMQEVGGDGFLLFNAHFDRRYVMEICDGLVPELQRRGLTRKAYAHKHFRDNLMEF